MCALIAPTDQNQLENSAFSVDTIRGQKDETGDCECSHKDCSNQAETQPLELPGVADGAAVPWGNVAFCSLECLHKFRDEGPYTNVLTESMQKKAGIEDPDGHTRGRCHIYVKPVVAKVYLKTSNGEKGVEFALGANKKEAIERITHKYIDRQENSAPHKTEYRIGVEEF